MTAGPEAPLPGYACVVSKRHVVEPFELPDAQLAAFWGESMVVARALCAFSGLAKMNYEIHGNTLPHLHMHLFPRFRGDPFANGPIDTRRCTFTRSLEELERLGKAILDVRHTGAGVVRPSA